MWSLGDCIDMTAITITTVGFEEVLELDAVPGGREWTLVLLVFGTSANLCVVSSITSFFVEGDFTNIRRCRRLQRRMRDIENHTIVCGVGRTGRHVLEDWSPPSTTTAPTCSWSSPRVRAIRRSASSARR